MTAAELALTALITKLKSQRAAAKHLGISQAFVSAMVRGERPMSAKVLSKLGFRRAVVKA
jgi:predicted transcriptional regulator